MKTKLLPFLLLLVLASSAAAFFVDDGRWTKNRTVVMFLKLDGAAMTAVPGKTLTYNNFNDAAVASLNAWNQHMAHMQFTTVQTTAAPVDGDANNTVFFSNTIYGDAFGSNTLAVALRTTRDDLNPQVYMEGDVIFSTANTGGSPRKWSTYTGGGSSVATDFTRVALHEFGHVLGLNHPDQANPPQANPAIMNSTASGTLASLQQDDINGAVAIYGTGPVYLNGATSSNFVNLSTRGKIGLNDNRLIGGFIIQGSTSATVVLRAIGGSLVPFGLAGAIEDPILTLNGPSGFIQSNDDWIDGTNPETIASYRLDPRNSREAAIIANLAPGNYTVVVEGFDSTYTGIGLVELYDLHTGTARAANISTRGQVLNNDDVLIGGFIAGAGANKDVILRAIGPALAGAVANALSNPRLELVNANGTVLESNDDWGSGPDAASIQMKGFAPSNSLESALEATLTPGNYTAIIRGVGGATGIGLFEAYDLSPAP